MRRKAPGGELWLCNRENEILHCLEVTEKMVMISQATRGTLRRSATSTTKGCTCCGRWEPPIVMRKRFASSAQRSLGVVRPVASRVVEFAPDSTRRHATHRGGITHEQQPASRTEQRRETLLTAVANSVIRSASKGGSGKIKKINARSPSRTRVARGTAEATRQHDERDRAAKHVVNYFGSGIERIPTYRSS
jgi:hypothetical protein